VRTIPLFVQTSRRTQKNQTSTSDRAPREHRGQDTRAERAANGVDEDALVRENLPLIQYAVSELAHRIPSYVSRNDLVSAGMLGLAQAARSFDPARGIAFERFASTRIRGALLDELRGRDWASRSVRSRARRMQTVTQDLTNRLGRTPTPAEVAEGMGIDTTAAHKLVDDVHRATVLNYESLVLEGTSELFLVDDGENPEDAIVSRERRAYLTDAVSALPERLRRVVVGYFFEECSMQELADELGVSESRVSQLRAEALALLKDGMNAHLDPESLPAEPRPNGRVAKRKAAYYARVAEGSTYASRLDSAPASVQEKIVARAYEAADQDIRKAS
jgi:RNA polymerase sigma factor FliA